jgi:wyosine [tRNA(Phe)-imidazoG37] synthetase (radical SAM superfamily)
VAERPLQITGAVPAVQDHSRQYADFTLVYPVISRRSGGLSLGVNLNPDKICNFDCVYCEVDRRIPGLAGRVDPRLLASELTALIGYVKRGGLETDPRFAELSRPVTREIRDIAFSGDGEPTMVHNFAACVEAVVAVKRAEGLEEAKLVLITDAAGLDKQDVRRGLELMDANAGEIWGKLDAGTADYFRRVNRTTIRFDRILSNLLHTARVRPIVIQTLFLKVHGEMMSSAELEAYCERLNELLRGDGRIKEIHAYTIARPTPEPYATRLSEDELERVAGRVRERTGLTVRTFV